MASLAIRHRLELAFGSPLLRRLGLLASWVLVGIAATLLATTIASLLTGQKLVTIDSDSQAPALRDGDIVLERQVSPGDVEAGQIITFSEPGTGNRLTHRVKTIEQLPGEVRIVTKGDSARTFERFTVPEDGEVGLVVRRIPWAGRLAGVLGAPLAVLCLPLAVLTAMGWLGLRRRRLRPGT